MNIFMRCLVFSLFLLTLAACGSGASGTNVTVTDTGNIEGTVKDSVTGAVIPAVAIQIGTQAAITGTNGVYSVSNLNIGTRTVTATKSGYQAYSGTVTIEKGVTISHNIQMIPTSSTLNTSAKVTIGLTGTLPATSTIVGTDFTLTLPANVTPLLNSGAVESSVIALTSTFAGGSLTPPVYTPATASTAGTLKITLVNAAATGITQVGEVATVTLQLANNAAPVAANFGISAVSVIDRRGTSIAGMGAAVSNVTLQ